jgi:hypothetical protein
MAEEAKTLEDMKADALETYVDQVRTSTHLSPEFRERFAGDLRTISQCVEYCQVDIQDEVLEATDDSAPKFGTGMDVFFVPMLDCRHSELELVFYEMMHSEGIRGITQDWMDAQYGFVASRTANEVELAMSFTNRGDVLINAFLTDEADRVPGLTSKWYHIVKNRNNNIFTQPYHNGLNRTIYEYLYSNDSTDPSHYNPESAYRFLARIRADFMAFFNMAPRLDAPLTLYRGRRVPRVSSYTVDAALACFFALGAGKYRGRIEGELESVVNIVTFPVGTPHVFMHGISVFPEAEVIVPPIFKFRIIRERLMEITGNLPGFDFDFQPETRLVRCLFIEAIICPASENDWSAFLFGDERAKMDIKNKHVEPEGGW